MEGYFDIFDVFWSGHQNLNHPVFTALQHLQAHGKRQILSIKRVSMKYLKVTTCQIFNQNFVLYIHIKHSNKTCSDT